MFNDRIDRIINPKSTKEYWENLNFFRRSRGIGQSAVTPERWFEYYAQIFPVRMNSIEHVENHYVSCLNDPITLRELENSLNSMKEKKAAGFDGIPAEFYKYLPQNWKNIILKIIKLY